MFYKICAFFVAAGICGFSYADGNLQQVVTSEVFYDYGEETAQREVADETRYVATQEYVEPDYYTQNTPIMVEQRSEVIPVWPVAGTDADFKIACQGQECLDGGDGELKIVSQIGSGLVIENNINTRGIGWSGGPDIVNQRPIPTGFDYECINSAEMPLLQREMMEDDGGTVLSMSRSPRRICNKQSDEYIAFAERKGFAGGANTSETVQSGNSEIRVNEYVDAEPALAAQNEIRSWVVASGQTLRAVLESWCTKEGWDLVWTTPREYPIEASAVFKGRFVDVASALVRNFERAAPAPYAKFYKGNRVLVVSTIEE